MILKVFSSAHETRIQYALKSANSPLLRLALQLVTTARHANWHLARFMCGIFCSVLSHSSTMTKNTKSCYTVETVLDDVPYWLAKMKLAVLSSQAVADIPLLGTSTADDAPSRAPKVAILFSGGLDCTILARLAHEILDPKESIDLLNVAFENPRSVAAARLRPNFDPYEACPDRITGRRSFVELFKACPGREFRFVAIDIPFSETQAHRSTVISLMYPQNTEMDLSISMALYFAARGKGTATISPNVSLQENSATAAIPPYTTSARVLLSGLGADELFAGYTRHATAFSRQGYPGLIAELALDITRLGTRNLGRDDRIISHCSKEVRYPYLDEDFVKWALQAPVWEKCGFGEHRPQPSDSTSIVSESNVTLHQHRRNVTGEDKDINGIEPAKKVLRLLAQTLDLPGVAREKKRAIQFGAKTAKMETGGGKTKGTDVLLS
ncbi:putative asparagine synthase related protein [Phaeomoniella chlamydospora]|uniref:Putative asparagine synthase related protein n=1 Tax=Phaeomoniella chlamydospora TaxID=158046 RepID=A0A0G2H589_PHACM|nr:putative asparagine synthase related protein [Phaeomoniella chlamydospora]